MPIRPVERYRLKNGPMGSHEGCGANGCFEVPTIDGKDIIFVIISDELGWDHVSASLHSRTPTWDEMQWLKRMFFEPQDTVIQIHPPDHAYVNKCKNCLHLWRCQDQEIKLPPTAMVG